MHTGLIAIFIGLCSINASAIDTAPDGTKDALTTIEALDVPRYMGIWYEIAKYPNWFQRKCTGNTTAEYSLKSDGKVQVVNRCRMENDEINEAVGSARQVGATTSPRLEVRFAPAWLSFIPAVWGDYWIIDLDEGYQLAAVSEPTRQYLWVLSRRPRIDQATYDALVGRLAKKGYDVRNLELTKQDD
jgi:apolipoprotein D and lipocalin family protein